METKRKNLYRTGLVVLIILGILTAFEFFLGVLSSALWLPLLAIALVKAVFVLRDYMHIGLLFAGDEEEH